MNRFKLSESVMPPTYFWSLAVASILFHVMFRTETFVPGPYNLSGLFFILAGIAINLHTDSLFRKHGTTVKPHKKPSKLVIEGSFRYSRHPMYLGMFFALTGLAVFLGTAVSFVFPVLFFALMELIFIPVEEETLEREFKSYASYKKKVRKWL